MDLVVGGRGLLTDYGFGAHVKPGRDRCRIDLSGMTFVDPFGLVTIAALAEWATNGGRGVGFTRPDDEDCRRYLHRLGLASVMDSLEIDHGLHAVRRHDTGDRLLELRRFDADADAADDLAEQVYRIFADGDPEGAGILYDAINEIAQNVVDHSDRSGGYFALQQFPKSGEVSFAIADSGVGLRHALGRTMTVRDDAQAIGLAVRRHVTSTGEEGRGVGLNSVVRHSRGGGRVQLWTGLNSGVFTRGQLIPQLRNHLAPFPGTVAQARLRLQ